MSIGGYKKIGSDADYKKLIVPVTYVNQDFV